MTGNMHTMELPRLIEIGEKNLDGFGRFLCSLAGGVGYGSSGSGSSAGGNTNNNTGSSAAKKARRHIPGVRLQRTAHHQKDSRGVRSSLPASRTCGTRQARTVPTRFDRVRAEIEADDTEMVAGIGGGRSVDTAKMISFGMRRPFVSVPTAASHDGMASPFVSIKSDQAALDSGIRAAGGICGHQHNQERPARAACKRLRRF